MTEAWLHHIKLAGKARGMSLTLYGGRGRRRHCRYADLADYRRLRLEAETLRFGLEIGRCLHCARW